MKIYPRHIKHLWKAFSIVGLIILAACSDGAPSAEGPKPSINPPVINKFTVAKAGESGGGTSVTIDAGGSVELAWSVGGADKVELKSAGNKLAVHEVQAEGKETVTDIQSDESFTLTAYNQGVSVQSTVRVSVPKQATLEILSFTAQPATVEPGQSTTLCYEVNPVEAEIHIFDATGAEVPLATTEKPADETPVEESEEPKSIVEGVSLAIMAPSINLPPPGRAAEAEVTAETPPTGGTTGPAIPPPGTPEPVMPTAATNKGCSVEVTPAATTSYVLVAKLADGTSKDATATVTVAEGLTIESFVAKDANGKEVTQPLTAPGKVTLEWVVKPADAKVEIDQGVGDVTSATVNGKGSKEVEVKATTTFTLTASKEGMASQSLSLSIAVEAPKLNPNLQLQASTQNIFAGEEVTLSTVVMDTMGGAPTESLVVRGPDGKEIQGQGTTVKVKPMQSGAYQAVRLGDTVVTSNAVQVNVRTWEHPLGADSQWSVATGPSGSGDQMFAGTAKGDADHVMIATHSTTNEWKTAPVDYKKLFAKLAFASFGEKPETKVNIDLLKKFGPLPVNAFAIDSQKNDGKRIYAAMAGALLYSKDGGANFDIAEVFPLIDSKAKFRNTPESHMSCNGFKQQGISSAETDFVGIQQVCDVIVDRDAEGSSERVIVATDYGVNYVDDIDRLMANRSKVENGWKGVPRASEKMSPAANIYNMVAHDIELVRNNGSTTLFAATQHGVYVSTARGEKDSWQPFNGGDLGEYDLTTRTGEAKPVYAIAVDAANNKIYAGSDDGIYTRDLSLVGEGWKKVGASVAPPVIPEEPETPPAPLADETAKPTAPAATPAPTPAPEKDCTSCVYSLAVGSDGTVLAGTGSGVLLSRDNGATFTDVSASLCGATASCKPTAVYSVAIQGGNYDIATTSGVFISHAQAPTSPESPVAPITPPPAEQPTAAAARKVTVAAVAGHKFEPAVIEVNVGDKVEITFVNNDTDDHTMTTEGYPALVNDLVGFDLLASAGSTTGAQVSFTATKAGEILFFCKYHKDAGMTGKIVVKEVVPH